MPDVPPSLFEFDIDPADLPRLLRTPPVTARREGRVHTSALRIVWHDTAGAELAAAGLSLGEQGARWQLARLRPNGAGDWHPATPAPVLDEAPAASQLRRPPPGLLVPVAAFSGRQRVASLAGPATLTVLEGALRGVASDRPACRLLLAGPLPDMAVLATELADCIELSVPRAGLAAEAMSVASGLPPAARRSGAPRVPPGVTVDAALGIVVSHLADVILHWSRLAPAGETAEPVHQMRVAVRRLRCAISVFRRAAGPVLDELADALKTLAAALGAARDWDVFAEGVGASIGHAFAGDKRVESLLAAAERRRRDAYASLSATLAGRDFRRLALRLAMLPSLQPWTSDPPAPDLLREPARAYASRVLDRRLKHVTACGETLAMLPAEALHDVRKQAKRLRYAAEFFTPLFAEKPVRRFIARLEKLQEALGTMNDAHVARALMDQLGGGAGRAFASGAVQGFVAAHSASAGAQVEHVWAKFRRQAGFWD
jgi:CHAD domain-containing protein